MTDRSQTTCDQCGKTDDHPKWNNMFLGPRGVETVSKHHDCLSVAEKRLLTESGQEKGSPKASAIIEACESGVKGDDLYKLIQSGDLPKATGKGGRNDV